MKKIAILGSTGSIGTQALKVIQLHKNDFEVISLVAYSSLQKLNHQTEQFNPKYTALVARDGEECLIKAIKDADLVLFAMRGIISIPAVLYCIEHNLDVAIANKEVLVCAGELIKNALKTSKSKIFPVDSEHSAIWQCLTSKPKKLILTASGGPFRTFKKNELENVTVEQALSHPNWSMGQKITIDSATMMNKAFEVIEARYLFDISPENIQIVIHKESIIHSFVEFEDGAMLAQLSNPDMTLPIQYALLNKKRAKSLVKPLDLVTLSTLTFEKCDFETFPCANLGHEVLKSKHLSIVLTSANDVCVEAFLNNKINFNSIYINVVKALQRFKDYECDVLNCNDIFALHKEVSMYMEELINHGN